MNTQLIGSLLAIVFLGGGMQASAQCTSQGRNILHVGDSLTAAVSSQIIADDQANGASSTVIAQYGLPISQSAFQSLLSQQGKTISQFNGVVIALGTNDARGGVQGTQNQYGYFATSETATQLRANIAAMMQWIGTTTKVQWIVPHFPNIPNQDTNDPISSRLSYSAMQTLTAVLEVRAALEEASLQYPNLSVTDFTWYLPYMTGQVLPNHLISDGTHMDTFAQGWFATFHSSLATYTASTCTAAKLTVSAVNDAAINVVVNGQ